MPERQAMTRQRQPPSCNYFDLLRRAAQ